MFGDSARLRDVAIGVHGKTPVPVRGRYSPSGAEAGHEPTICGGVQEPGRGEERQPEVPTHALLLGLVVSSVLLVTCGGSPSNVVRTSAQDCLGGIPPLPRKRSLERLLHRSKKFETWKLPLQTYRLSRRTQWVCLLSSIARRK